MSQVSKEQLMEITKARRELEMAILNVTTKLPQVSSELNEALLNLNISITTAIRAIANEVPGAKL